MRAEIIAVGDELLHGGVVNSNATWLGQQLSDVGVDLRRCVVVGDQLDVITEALREAWRRVDLVLLTGGLGPTQDDLTRDAVAAAAGVPLVRDPGLQQQLTRQLQAAGRRVPERNFRQADLPQGAQALPNGRGTAPGLLLDAGGRLTIALPGPPHELEPMFTVAVLPELARRVGGGSVLVHRQLRTVGLWESAVAEAMAPEVERVSRAGNPVIAFLASGGMTTVKITARAGSLPQAQTLIAPVETFARQVLGPALFGADGDTLESVLVAAMAERGLTIACAESLTGGLLTGRLTAVPGASAVVRGGVVAYATEAKSEQLGVDPGLLARDGAVSAAAARAMARGVRQRFASSIGVALTGVAGPEPQEGKAPGTVHVAVSGPGPAADTDRTLHLPGDRDRVRTYSVVAAVDLVRRVIGSGGSR